MENRCQWANVVVPLAYAERLRRVGKRSQEEMWGQVSTKAMMVAIGLVLKVVGSDGGVE